MTPKSFLNCIMGTVLIFNPHLSLFKTTLALLQGFLFIVIVNSCSYPQGFPQPDNPQAVSLKVVNYNLWHGLGSTGIYKRKVLEPEGHKDRRYKRQIEILKQEKPDILFLQEVNPVESLSKKTAKELDMDYVFQNTNCGISVFGFGPPFNLDMGISILVRPPLEIREILGLKLSGPLGGCNPYLTFQYAEFRYALYALAYHPDYGSFLLVNTHFHHGVEWSPEVREQIEAWSSKGILNKSQKLELEKVIEESNQRRYEELKNLFSELKEIQKHYGSIPLILAGDFNSTFQSPLYKNIVETYQLKDSAGNYSSEPFTWDPPKNEQNHKYTSQFGSSVPDFDKPEVEAFFKKYNQRQRRIDYIFVNSDIQILSHSLFATQPDKTGIIGSDHFGLLVIAEILPKGTRGSKKTLPESALNEKPLTNNLPEETWPDMSPSE